MGSRLSNLSILAPLVFDGENYQAWSMRMQAYKEMKEFELIKEYFNKLVDIANKVRVLGTELSNSRLVQKVLVYVPEKYKSTIASLENTKRT
ncbi:hypothetical protein PVK06_042886 [Gossypium arboreum]|uniref:Uncharacterized protein n=1 Tax=Gossypium arboreum TaxID=29729 RepID=A0ABR0MLZ7_GOSAR|nr:hypothetical protein PVK06_042886 [Gossypium arboreum]